MPRRHSRPPGSRSTKLRRQASRALAHVCVNCGATEKLELDHINNRAEGGSDTLDNLQYLCRTCHEAKTEDERRRGVARAQARRGSLSKRYRDVEPHPGAV